MTDKRLLTVQDVRRKLSEIMSANYLDWPDNPTTLPKRDHPNLQHKRRAQWEVDEFLRVERLNMPHEEEQFEPPKTILELEIEAWTAAKKAADHGLYHSALEMYIARNGDKEALRRKLVAHDISQGHGFCEPNIASIKSYVDAELARRRTVIIKHIQRAEIIPAQRYPLFFEGMWYHHADRTAYIPATTKEIAAQIRT